MVIGLAGGCLGVLVVAVAPNIPVVLLGWCLAQLMFNALLAAQMAVLPDQVPAVQRGFVAGVLGICVPVAAVVATFVVKLFSGHQLAMFLAPCAVGGFFVVLFAATLDDRRVVQAGRPRWSVREFASTFYVNPRRNPDFAWAFASRFLLVLAYAFLTTYQVYYLLEHLGSTEDDVPQQVFLATLTQSSVVVAASLLSGRLSDRARRRKIFVLAAALVYGLAMLVVAGAGDFHGFLLGVGLSGLGFGMYFATSGPHHATGPAIRLAVHDRRRRRLPVRRKADPGRDRATRRTRGPSGQLLGSLQLGRRGRGLLRQRRLLNPYRRSAVKAAVLTLEGY
jgi:MFS family permease